MTGTRTWLRSYLAGDRLVERVVDTLRGVWDGWWLGLLDDEQLALLDGAYYDGEAVYRTEAHNRRGLFDWEEHVVSEHFAPGSRVVVTGAGGGREVLALLSRGYDAQGFEPNQALAAFGSALTSADGHGERVTLSTRSGWPEGVAPSDAVMLGWGSYMLVPSRSARIDLLRAASAATGGRGPVVLSYFTLPKERRQFHVAARVATVLRRLRRREPPLLGDALVPNFAHHFTRRQVAEEVAAAGLALTESGLSGGGYGWAVGRGTSATP
jgi:hypothetical protein